ncbi:protein [Escherichia coli]|nr:protein [Escherichia coli]
MNWGDFVLHMDGLANDFLPDAGRWQWRYWGKGSFTPMNATWDVAGKGEWHDSTITLTISPPVSTSYNTVR